MNEYYNYSDIYLKPSYSELTSRANADISVNFLGRKFKAPWIPANMASVLNEDIAKWCSENDYFYIMHRFCDVKSFITKATQENWKNISISIGVKKEDYDLVEWLYVDQERATWGDYPKINYITIDIAHGHSVLMKSMITHIKKWLPHVKIIAGNVATPEAVRDLALWGADCVKVGIAGGGACSTKNMTGFHVPMFSCVGECSNQYVETNKPLHEQTIKELNVIPIIADGGIRENGDFAKALTAGATMVMGGSIFAACIDAPGDTVEKYIHVNNEYVLENGIARPKLTKKLFKCYYGSASKLNKEKTGQKSEHIEGFEVDLPCNGLTYAQKYQQLTESLKSSVSYAGGKDLSAFRDVEWVVVK